jgi:hypothetical protein
LIVGPAVGHDGNLLFAVLFGIYFIFVNLYYPVLVLVGVIQGVAAWRKHRRAS